MRVALVASLLFILGGVAQANPVEQQQLPLLPSDAPVHTTNSWSWIDCGLPSDVVHVNSVDVTPDPPKPGEPLTVSVKATVEETIHEGAYADVVVKLGLIKLLQKRFDLCEEARKANATVTCPVPQGELHITQTVALPKEIPRAKFTVDVRGYTADDEDMVCVKLNVDFLPKTPFPRIRW